MNVLFYLKRKKEKNVFKCFLLKNLDTKKKLSAATKRKGKCDIILYVDHKNIVRTNENF